MSEEKIKQELLETGELLYCCPKCPFKADKIQTTKIHILKHSGQFPCHKCKKSCRSQKDLDSHMKNVHKEKPTVAEKTTVDRKKENKVNVPNGERRLRRGKKKEPCNGKFRCEFCDYATDRQLLLNQHCKYHLNSSVIKHLCPACFQPFPSPYHVKRHIRYNHPDTLYSLIKLEPKKVQKNEVKDEVHQISTPSTPKTPPKKKQKMEKLESVEKSPKQKKKLDTQKKIAITPESKQTPPEPRTTVNQKSLFQCAHCKYSTTQKNHLRQHMTYHSSKYVCPVCQKSFPCARRREMHVERIHNQTIEENTEENEESRVKNEPITSSLWGFDLSDFGIDAIVINDEIEEALPIPMEFLPTYSSNVFPKDFHVQTEAPTDAENPFFCPFCPYRGKKKRNLDSHMVYHTDKFKCEICTKRHPTLYHLNRHIRLVHCANPDEIVQKREQQQQSSPSLYFPADSKQIKEESNSSLPFNLSDLMAVETTEDLNGTIKQEPTDFDCDETLNTFDDTQIKLPNEIQSIVMPDGVKMYFCTECSYQNTKKQNVKQHWKIHTMQHACVNCGKGHTTSFHLKRHLKFASCTNPKNHEKVGGRKRSKIAIKMT
uniref:CSON012323 protein n=1 Tax=Culicoides sonorensis TaxID=179676 RepID=A0A336M560_CULSO